MTLMAAASHALATQPHHSPSQGTGSRSPAAAAAAADHQQQPSVSRAEAAGQAALWNMGMACLCQLLLDRGELHACHVFPQEVMSFLKTVHAMHMPPLQAWSGLSANKHLGAAGETGMTVRAAHHWSDAAGSLCRCLAGSMSAFPASRAAVTQHGLTEHAGQVAGQQLSQPAVETGSAGAGRPAKRQRHDALRGSSELAAAWEVLSNAAGSSGSHAPLSPGSKAQQPSGSMWVQLAAVCHVSACHDSVATGQHDWPEQLAAAAAAAAPSPHPGISAACAMPCLLAALECLHRAASLMKVRQLQACLLRHSVPRAESI